MRNFVIAALFFLIALTGWRELAVAAPAGTPTPSATGTRTATLAPRQVTATGTLTPTLALTATRGISATPTITLPPPTGTPAVRVPPTATPIRYNLALEPNALAIESLRVRPYGGAGVRITKIVLTGDAYRQALIEYSSDGLRITGTMNIPRGAGPFPVVVLDHGYFKPAEYKTGDGTSRAADAFARHGYLTLAPDYRCYAGSQCAANPFYIGYAVDVVNLIAQIASIPDADPNRIGIWGHSMGGQVTLRALALTDTIKVAALYGALTGDDEAHYCWLRGCRTAALPSGLSAEQKLYQRLAEADPDFLVNVPALAAPLEAVSPYHEIFVKSSPTKYLGYVNTPLIIHHGEADDIVPLEWSTSLAHALSAQGKTAMLYTYPGEGHVFAGWGWQLFMARTLAFFDEFLNPRATPVTADKRVWRQERLAADASY